MLRLRAAKNEVLWGTMHPHGAWEHHPGLGISSSASIVMFFVRNKDHHFPELCGPLEVTNQTQAREPQLLATLSEHGWDSLELASEPEGGENPFGGLSPPPCCYLQLGTCLTADEEKLPQLLESQKTAVLITMVWENQCAVQVCGLLLRGLSRDYGRNEDFVT